MLLVQYENDSHEMPNVRGIIGLTTNLSSQCPLLILSRLLNGITRVYYQSKTGHPIDRPRICTC